jgi:prepilin-type N-terminal cleavage/methylation domain-containing protein
MKNVNSLFKRVLVHRKTERGVGFIEVLIAIALLGLLSVVYLGGTSVALRIMVDETINSTSQALAAKKMEKVKNPSTTVYDSTNPIAYQQTDYITCSIANGFDSDYTDYFYNVTVNQVDTKLQKITVNIKQNDNPNPIITLTDIKVDR